MSRARLQARLIAGAGVVLFWVVQVAIIWRGIESIRVLESWAAPFLIVMGLLLLVWAYRRADGFGPMLAAPSQFAPRSDGRGLGLDRSTPVASASLCFLP